MTTVQTEETVKIWESSGQSGKLGRYAAFAQVIQCHFFIWVHGSDKAKLLLLNSFIRDLYRGAVLVPYRRCLLKESSVPCLHLQFNPYFSVSTLVSLIV